jgi:hypothetical protein
MIGVHNGHIDEPPSQKSAITEFRIRLLKLPASFQSLLISCIIRSQKYGTSPINSFWCLRFFYWWLIHGFILPTPHRNESSLFRLKGYEDRSDPTIFAGLSNCSLHFTTFENSSMTMVVPCYWYTIFWKFFSYELWDIDMRQEVGFELSTQSCYGQYCRDWYKSKILVTGCATVMNISTGGLVGYDDWFTPSRSGVRFPPGV